MNEERSVFDANFRSVMTYLTKLNKRLNVLSEPAPLTDKVIIPAKISIQITHMLRLVAENLVASVPAGSVQLPHASAFQYVWDDYLEGQPHELFAKMQGVVIPYLEFSNFRELRKCMHSLFEHKAIPLALRFCPIAAFLVDDVLSINTCVQLISKPLHVAVFVRVSDFSSYPHLPQSFSVIKEMNQGHANLVSIQRSLIPVAREHMRENVGCNHCHVNNSFSKTKFKFCSRCRKARYCCREHQALDWPVHKLECTKIEQ